MSDAQNQKPKDNKEYNQLAVVALVFAFLIPLLGFVLSIIALFEIKNKKLTGKDLAVASIAVSSFMMIVTILLTILTVSGATKTTGTVNMAFDMERKSDIRILSNQIEVYYAENGYYPSLANLNDAGWVSQNMPGTFDDIFIDPGSPDTITWELTELPTADTYSYAAKNSGGEMCYDYCYSYELTAILENGELYVKQNLN